MNGLIDRTTTVEEIEEWFSLTPRETWITCLADTIREWEDEDLTRLRLTERGLLQEDIVKLLKTERMGDRWHKTGAVIHILVMHNHASTLISLLDQITSTQHLLSLVWLKDFDSELNVLSCAIQWTRLDLSHYLIKRLGKGESFALLCQPGVGKWSGLHWAIELPSSEVREILSLLENESQTHQLLSNQDREGQAVLTHSIWWGREECFQSILKYYTDKQSKLKLLELAAITDNEGSTSFHYAAGQDISNYLIDLIKSTSSPDTRDQLAKVLSMRNVNDGKKSWGYKVQKIHSDNELIYDWAFDSLINNRYLMFDFPSTLIMYNTINRPGADKEAESLENCLNNLGFKVKAKNSFTKNELFRAMRLCQLAESSRHGQIVALMSHGTEGCITDSNGEQIPLKVIEQRMCPNSHRDTPKLLILQCCQVQNLTGAFQMSTEPEKQPPSFSTCSPSSDGPSPSNLQHPPASYGPRSPNFCALMCTGARTVSERNTFIPFLAEAIRDAGVDSSISHQEMVSVKKRFPVNVPDQAPGCMDWFKFRFCIKSILPIYLGITRKTNSKTKRKQQDMTPRQTRVKFSK